LRRKEYKYGTVEIWRTETEGSHTDIFDNIWKDGKISRE
jgi:hypothetical protein